jgi:hypothetical protein
VSDVIFVRTRYDYPPYRDFYRLVTLSGYPLIYVDEMDVTDPAKTYIITPKNGEWGEGWPNAQARLVWWQLEWEQEPDPCPPGVAEKWTSDRWHADRIGARFVPLGSHPGFNLNPDETRPKRYDVAFMAYTDVWRRGQIKGALEEKGLSIAPNAWGYQRHENLLQSRCMVHVHQFDGTPTIAPLRWCIAAAYSLPIISESVNNREPFGLGHFMACDYEHLGAFIAMQLKAEWSNLEDYGRALHRFLCVEHPFRKNVEAAL